MSERRRDQAARLWRRGRGPLCSLLFHLLVVLLILRGLPEPAPPPPPPEEAVPINLVELGEETTAPPAAEKAALPQEEAPPAPPPPHPKPVAPKPPLPPAPKPRQVPQPPPVDDFAARLKAIAAQQARSAPSEAAPHNGAGLSNRTLGSDAATSGTRASYGVKDVVRAQIEKNWELDVTLLGTTPMAISLHLAIAHDGEVLRVDIVDDPRYSGLPNYHALATSARRAALLASPLQVPPGWTATEVTVSVVPRER